MFYIPETNIVNQLCFNLKNHMFWMLLNDVEKCSLSIKVENINYDPCSEKSVYMMYI